MAKQAKYPLVECEDCKRVMCDCGLSIWNYRYRGKNEKRPAWSLHGPDTRTPIDLQRTQSMECWAKEFDHGPVQRMSDPPFDFDAPFPAPFEEETEAEAVDWETMALVGIKLKKKRAPMQGFMHPPACDCAVCAPVIGPQGPAGPPSPCKGGFGGPTGATITVTQEELARLLFDGSTANRKRAMKHAELYPQDPNEPLDEADARKLQRVLDVMWNGQELERREMAELRAAGAFRTARYRKP